MWTDSNGQIRLVNLKPDTYVVTGTKAPDGYILDTASQTVAVSRSDTQTLTFTNTPLLPGATFEIYTRSGRRVDTVKTGSNGVASPSSCPRRATNP